MVTDIAIRIMSLYPNSTPLVDWIVEDNGTQTITYWNPALGPQPTLEQLAAVVIPVPVQAPDTPGFIAATKAALGGIVAVNALMRYYPTFLDAIQQQEWTDVKALIQNAVATGVLNPTQVTAILGIAKQYHIPIPA